jgi:hypothetical protein
VNCFVVPTAVAEFAGVTAIDIRVAAVTVSDALPLTVPDVAVMEVAPVPTLVANPLGFTVATDSDEEDQLTDGSSCVLPSSKLPTALNCSVVPAAMDWTAGLTEIDVKCAGTTVKVVLSVSPATVAVMVVDPAAMVAARPELSTVATEVEDEVHVTPLARSELEPSL